MATSFDELRKTIQNMVHLASCQDNTEKPLLQINGRQCELLLKKASEILPVLEELEDLLRHNELHMQTSRRTPDWTPAAKELHRVLKDAEVLVKDCCCGGQWLKVEIMRGNLKETFAKILYDMEWHTWALSSLFVEKVSGVFKNRVLCDGNLRLNDLFILSAAARRDRESLRELLNSSHVCEREACKSSLGDHCLAGKLLAKLDAEDEKPLDRSNLRALLTRFLWIDPQDFPKGKRVGRGGYAKVRETEWLGQKLAQKVLPDGSGHNKVINKEIAAMVALDHPNIVRVVCCSQDERNLSIVMELMYKSLFDLQNQDCPISGNPFPILQSVDLMQQIAEGVRYLHSLQLVHRDLKSHNVLIRFAHPQTSTIMSLLGKAFGNNNPTAPLVAKIADFGLSKVKSASTIEGNQTENTGTRAWMAPESIAPQREEPATTNYTRFHPMKLDVYSFGIICYEILTGDEPFRDVPKTQISALVKSGERPKLPEKTPERLVVLIQQCWHKIPLLRPDFAAICTELRYIKGLLLQGHDFANDMGRDFNFKIDSIMVQGPWGGDGGETFCTGIVTSFKQIKLKYDSSASNIWYMEIECCINELSFVMGYGKKEFGTITSTINIDGPNEYIVQIEGSFGGSLSLPSLTVVQSLTIHTNKNIHGPFGRKTKIGNETNFCSKFGKIVGFFGKKSNWLDQIGCYVIPNTIINP